MNTQVAFGKRQLVVDTLADKIKRGDLDRGQRLAGENQLAQEFDVSRGTIRSALSELQRRRLITTRTGIGSFVTFDGHTLDQRRGWAQALSDAGFDIATSVLDISPAPRSATTSLPEAVPDTEGIAVRRLRSTLGPSGVPLVVSFECAWIPSIGSLRELPANGLKDGSLWASLAAEGLVANQGSQRVDIHALDAREAGILARPQGTAFLRSIRTSFTADGRFVEHVVSLLDPDHFTLNLTFGDAS
ncbi:MAG: GntR family transcriptional regulator [Propionibacterium sp.]